MLTYYFSPNSEQVMQYFPQGNFIMKRTNSCYSAGPGMDVRSSLPGEFRSAAEAVLTWHMMDNVMNKLEEFNPVLLYTFRGNRNLRYMIFLCLTIYLSMLAFISRDRNENRNNFSLYGIIRHWHKYKIITRIIIGYFKRNAIFRNKSL